MTEVADRIDAGEGVALDGRFYEALDRYWGYRSFRPNQAEAIGAVCSGRDAVVVLPTGGGKSICYQLPAVCHLPAIVVSPLISLMQDQVAALDQHGIEAAFVNSSLSQNEAGQRMLLWKTGALKLLYVAPERLLMSSFLNFLGACPPAFFAIDEAHCISHWGHDFRPEYRNLSTLRARFPEVPICALTATATERVRRDIADQLALNEPAMIVGNFDRPNLHYRAERRTHRNSQVEEVLQAHAGKSGIVYCISRKDTESVAGFLAERGFKTAAYHAGLDHERRRNVQRAFSNEELDAVVATVAFGMGIDRSNVRFVVHAGLPCSVEHYQQETGRAGRDGLPAECVLLYSAADEIKWRSIYEKDASIPEEILETKLTKLREMMRFAYDRRCRHRYLIEYFGQKWDKGECGNCDCCSPMPETLREEPESTVIAQKILSCVARLNNGYGAQYVIWVLRAETDKVQPAHCGLSTFGLLKETHGRVLAGWIDDCIAQGLLVRSAGEYPRLAVTEQGWAVMRGQKQAMLRPARSLAPAPADRRKAKKERVEKHREHADLGLQPAKQAVFEALRKMRMQFARERNVPAFVIMPDSTLLNIACALPSTMEQLADVQGIGSAKLAAFGKAILDVVRAEAGQISS